MMAVSVPVSESEIWTLKQCLLKTKCAMYSLQSQLYKSRAYYEERVHALTLQLDSLHTENDRLRSLVEKCQSDLETFHKQVTKHITISVFLSSLVN